MTRRYSVALAAAAVLVAASLMAGCGSSSSPKPAAPTSSTPVTPVPVDNASGGSAAKVFLIIGENTSASQITSRHAPYLASQLKPKARWIMSYHSFPKPSSLGNYVAMVSGQYTKCEANNDLPDHCHQNVDNIFAQLQATHHTWLEFNEGAANGCDIVDHGAAWSKNIYSAHHDPVLYFTGLHGSAYDEAIAPKAPCRTLDVPMGTSAPNDTSTMDGALKTGMVADFNVLIPNDCENGHDPCGTVDPVRQFDDFLAREIPKIQASPAYGPHSTIIVTWDEGADKPLDPANPLLLVIGTDVSPATISTGAYNHYSLLRSLEHHFGLPTLAHAKTATPLPGSF